MESLNQIQILVKFIGIYFELMSLEKVLIKSTSFAIGKIGQLIGSLQWGRQPV